MSSFIASEREFNQPNLLNYYKFHYWWFNLKLLLSKINETIALSKKMLSGFNEHLNILFKLLVKRLVS